MCPELSRDVFVPQEASSQMCSELRLSKPLHRTRDDTLRSPLVCHRNAGDRKTQVQSMPRTAAGDPGGALVDAFSYPPQWRRLANVARAHTFQEDSREAYLGLGV